jgi:hydroxymethylbilane synthase
VTAFRIAPYRKLAAKAFSRKKIEEALLEGHIDLAVHSSKDMPTQLPDGLAIKVFLPREDIRDAYISRDGTLLEDLPEGAVIGTASLRRQAQLKRLRPDLNIAILRGNVQTRFAKLERGEVDAMLLAMAGLRRLGLEDKATQVLDTDTFLPAVGQGAICIETRHNDDKTDALLMPLNHTETASALACERAFLTILDGSCRTPIAGHASLKGDVLTFRGMVLKPDGSNMHETKRIGPASAAIEMGTDAGSELKARMGPGFMDVKNTE